MLNDFYVSSKLDFNDLDFSSTFNCMIYRLNGDHLHATVVILIQLCILIAREGILNKKILSYGKVFYELK
jgi:hypothetical protein